LTETLTLPGTLAQNQKGQRVERREQVMELSADGSYSDYFERKE